MKCLCRLQVSDMGYYECQLEKGHEGNHKFVHNGESFPRRNYLISWEPNEKFDIIFTEEMLKETNLNEVIEKIESLDIVSEVRFEYNDDYDAIPKLMIYVELKMHDLTTEQDSEIWYNIYNIYNILKEIKYKNEILDDMSIVNILLSVY